MNVNSVLNCIIAVLIIAGMYTLFSLMNETSPPDEGELVYVTESVTETTTAAVTTVTEPPATTTAVTTTSPRRQVQFVTEKPVIIAAMGGAQSPPQIAITANTTIAAAAKPTTTTTPTTTAAPTTTTTPKTTTKTTTTAATTTKAPQPQPEDARLYEEDEQPDLYEDFDPDELLEEDGEDSIAAGLVTEQTAAPIFPQSTTAVFPDSTTVSDIVWNVDGGNPSSTSSTAKSPSSTSQEAAATLTARFNGKVQTVSAFELICAVVQNEINDVFEPEAIKAQAVAAYSYIKSANDNGDTPDVSVDYDYSKKIEDNVRAVWGMGCYYNGKLANTVYSASSAGYTASSVNVWGGSHPYLVSVATPFDVASDPNYGIKTTFSVSEMESTLESYFGISLSDNPAAWLVITEYIDGSYVGKISVDGQATTTGRKFRESVMGYSVRSSAFSVEYTGNAFTITTYGYGHGVGMSQNGANILAKQGYTFDQILRYYYTGVEVR